jgi:hypothetical protein
LLPAPIGLALLMREQFTVRSLLPRFLPHFMRGVSP